MTTHRLYHIFVFLCMTLFMLSGPACILKKRIWYHPAYGVYGAEGEENAYYLIDKGECTAYAYSAISSLPPLPPSQHVTSNSSGGYMVSPIAYLPEAMERAEQQAVYKKVVKARADIYKGCMLKKGWREMIIEKEAGEPWVYPKPKVSLPEKIMNSQQPERTPE